MAVFLNTKREDFPLNITNIKTEAISLYISRKPAMNDELNAELKFSGNPSLIGSLATTVNGIVGQCAVCWCHMCFFRHSTTSVQKAPISKNIRWPSR
jgi:hypothetical protein